MPRRLVTWLVVRMSTDSSVMARRPSPFDGHNGTLLPQESSELTDLGYS
jgi:hypothetical protein